MSEWEPIYTFYEAGEVVWPEQPAPGAFQTAWMVTFREAEDDTDWPVRDLSNDPGFGHVHVTRGGVCRHVRAEVIWSWVAGLVGLTIVDRRTWHSAQVISLDEAGGSAAFAAEGLRVQAERFDGTVRTATLSVDELWSELERLAGGEQS